MSNIKSDALVQGCSKRKFVLKISSYLTGKELWHEPLFIIKVQAGIKKSKHLHSHYIRRKYFPVKLVKFLRTPLKHRQFCRTCSNSWFCKVLFINFWFCNYIISEFLSKRWLLLLWEWDSFITPFSKESMQVNFWTDTCATK